MRGRTTLLTLMALAPAAGCGRKSPTTPLTPTAPTSGPPPKAVRWPLADGFESGQLADFWLPGDYGTGSHTPTAVTVTTEQARSGTRSARITVTEGDILAKGDDGKDVERAELDSGHFPLLGRDVWYGFSVLLPADFPVVDNRLVIGTIKQSDWEGSPLLGQRFRSGRHTLTIRPPGAAASGKPLDLPPLKLGSWVDLVYHLRYSTGGDGEIDVWMDGKSVLAYKGATASDKGVDRFYHKVGLYRDRWKQPMTMYLDNYTVGDSREGVDPATFDRRP